MRKLVPLLGLIACTNSADLPAPRADLNYSQVVEYRCSALNKSTAPSYLWINATDEGSGERWSTTIESTSIPKVEERDPNEDFRTEEFGSLLSPKYSAAILEEARRTLANLTDSEIEAQFTHNTSSREILRFTPQEAMAHALFERGFYPGRGDLTPSLFLQISPCKENRETLLRTNDFIKDEWKACLDELEERQACS